MALVVGLCASYRSASELRFLAFVSTAFGWLVFRFQCINDLNQVPVKFPEGEQEIGRTAENLMVSEFTFRWYFTRGTFPFGYSVIITNKRISIYYRTRWYRDIWIKDLKSADWDEQRRLNIRYVENGSEKQVVINTWTSFDLLIELMEKIGTKIPARPPLVST